MPTEKTADKKPARILTFDMLRGYFMVSIILNHLQWYPNGYDWVAMRGSLLVSAAEGFFLISGLVLGIVRGSKLIDKPFRTAASLLLQRGVLLYATSVILMLLFTFAGWTFFMDNPGLKPGIRPIDEPILDVIWGALSFNYIYGWADFLRLYSIFLLVSPLALWLLRKGKWYLLLIISAGLWALYPIALDQTGKSGELLMVFSWQSIFFAGFILGFHWNQLSTLWKNLSLSVRRKVLAPVLAIAITTLAINIGFETAAMLQLLPESVNNAYTSLHDTIFNKEALPSARLALFGLWFVLGFYIFHRFEPTIKKLFGWLILPFGQNSLYVYILHSVLIFLAHLIMQPIDATNPIMNFVGTTAILALIYYAVRKQFLFKIIPR